MEPTREKEELLRLLVAREARIAGLEHELAERSLEDPVTGLLSLAAFRTRLEEEVARCRRYERPIALVLIQLEGLLDFRATRGAAEAMARERMVGMVLRGLVRAADSVFRGPLGSFAVLLPETPPEGAVLAAERLLFELDGVFPASAGLACRTERQTADSLEASAQGALAEARAAGGGCVVVGSQPELEPWDAF